MLDAVVGAVIVVVATSSMLYSIEVFNRAIDHAGKHPFDDREEELLQRHGLSDEVQKEFKQAIDNAPEQLLDR